MPQSAIQTVPRVKVWLECSGEYVMGHGICQILEAIDECGAIKEAASRLGKSYRYVWGRVKEAEHALGVTLVETRVGGPTGQRSQLTDTAKTLVERFLRLRERLQSALATEFADCFAGTILAAPRPGR